MTDKNDKAAGGESSKSGSNSSAKVEVTHNLAATHAEEELLKPVWFANKIVDCPCTVCWGCVLFMFALTGIDAALFELSDEENRTWFVEDARVAEDFDAWILAGEARSDSVGTLTPQTQQQSAWTIQWMFTLGMNKKASSDTDYWLFTPEQLETIVTYEEMIINDTEWKDSFCYVVDTSTWQCDYDSVARDVAEHFNFDYASMTTEGIKEYVWELYQTSESPGTVLAAFNKEYVDTNQTTHYRSFLRSAMPITTSIEYIYENESSWTDLNDTDSSSNVQIVKTSRYRNDNHKEDKQEDKYLDWIEKYWDDITVDHEGKLKRNGVRIMLYEPTSFAEQFNDILSESTGWIVGAVAAVMFWIVIHLQSCFLSFAGVGEILLAFPSGYFIYRFIFQIDHFDTLSTLIVFILLGVGADDMFVMTDAWRQSLHFVDDRQDLKQRLSYAYRRAVKAVLITTMTTFFAFLATAASRIMPISAFGYWAALVVFCNFLLVITMYPAMLIVHWKYLRNCERKYLCCCCPGGNDSKPGHENKRQKSIKESQAQEAKNKDETVELTAKKDKQAVATAGGTNDDDDDDDEEDSKPPVVVRRQSSVEELVEEYGALETFFATTWANWVGKAKWVILLAFAVLFGVSAYGASQLNEQNDETDWFEEGHYMRDIVDFFDKYASSEESDLIYLTALFGVKGVNRDGTDKWDPEDYGKIVWDNSFDMSSAEAQQYMYDACTDLKTNELVFQESSVSCPILDFKLYLDSLGEPFPYLYTTSNDSYNASIQFDMFASKMYNFTETSFAVFANDDKLLFVESGDYREDGKDYVRYMAIGIYSRLETDANINDQEDEQDAWYDWKKNTFGGKSKNRPDGLTNPILSSGSWCWMKTNQEFITSAIQGICIALPLAWVVLMLSTQNWIMSIFATLDIIGVMICELGIMKLAGWDFGVTESVAIIIVIGFSVDYVVHMANAYLESTESIRKDRVSFALLTMGISVVSGAITTFLGGIFLTFPDMTFFVKMGILIMTTIALSLAWSMLFFIALLLACGPEYDTGNMPWCQKGWDFVMRKKAEMSSSKLEKVRTERS